MPLPRDVEAQLRAVAYLDDDQKDRLSDALEDLLAATLVAVPSTYAVSVSHGDADPRVTVLAATSGVLGPELESTSLSIRLPDRNGATLRVFARQPNALHQLAADLPALLDVHRREAVLTDDLMPTTTAENLAATRAALADASAVDRALGVLLERGIPPDRGHAYLEDKATYEGMTKPAAARALLDETRAAADPEPTWWPSQQE